MVFLKPSVRRILSEHLFP